MLMSYMILWESIESIGSRRNEPTIAKKEGLGCDCEKPSHDLEWSDGSDQNSEISSYLSRFPDENSCKHCLL